MHAKTFHGTEDNFNLRSPSGSDVAWIIKLRKPRYHELRASLLCPCPSWSNNFWVTKRTGRAGRDRDTHPSSTTQHSGGPRFKTFDKRNATSPRSDAILISILHPFAFGIVDISLPRLGPGISHSRRSLCASLGYLLLFLYSARSSVSPSNRKGWNYPAIREELRRVRTMTVLSFTRLQRDQLAYRSLSWKEGRGIVYHRDV